MKLNAALEIWRVSKGVVKKCKGGRQVNPCLSCRRIDGILHEILNGELILEYYGLDDNKKLGLKGLSDANYDDPKKLSNEINRRLKALKKAKGNEELPAELAMIFERLHDALKAHDAIED